jgi:DNA polymerase-3 subunit chi
MGQAMFYHLTGATLQETLPMLIGKARGAGWRVVVRGPDAAMLDALDAALWLGPADAFAAHGRAGGPHDALQQVLLCAPDQAAPAQCVMCVGGAQATPQEAAALERLCILFDGHDDRAVAQARAQWKTLTGAGVAAQYWAQEDGRWTRKAASG